ISSNEDSSRHVGYYLLDDGRRNLEARIGFQPTLRLRLRRWTQRHELSVYLGSILLLTTLVLFLTAAYLTQNEATFLRGLFALLIVLLPASGIAIQLVNWIISHNVP